MRPDHAIGGNIAVVGDIMLDKYIRGDAWRLSPEAPVPVVSVNAKSRTLGGAGNVALNLVGLGCKTWIFGARGDDLAGKQVSDILRKNSIRGQLCVDKELPTTTKTRVLANNQQLIRFDEEGRYNGRNGSYDELILCIVNALPKDNIQAVILSDYNKGVLSSDLVSKIIRCYRAANAHILVDPKRGDWSIYRSATLIKPNLSELEQATGMRFVTDADMVQTVQNMRSKYNLDAVLVTLGAKGMLLVTATEHEFIPAAAQEVFDVSGAGDTVIATLAACLCSGYSLSKSAKIANRAAGIVIGKLGTCPITIAELEAA